MRTLLDTNVISELVVKRPNTSVVKWVDSLDSLTVYLSVITIGEIQKGVEKLSESPRKQDLAMWLKGDLLLRFSDHLLDIDVHVMLTWGSLVSRLEREGRTIAAIDSLIAAQALHYGCRLATRNQDHFLDTGVAVVNPWGEP